MYAHYNGSTIWPNDFRALRAFFVFDLNIQVCTQDPYLDNLSVVGGGISHFTKWYILGSSICLGFLIIFCYFVFKLLLFKCWCQIEIVFLQCSPCKHLHHRGKIITVTLLLVL